MNDIDYDFQADFQPRRKPRPAMAPPHHPVFDHRRQQQQQQQHFLGQHGQPIVKYNRGL